MLQLIFLFSFLSLGVLVSAFVLESSRVLKLARFLNRWVIRVALPSLVLQKIHALPSFSLAKPEIFLPVSQPWIHFFLSAFVISIFARVWGWSRPTWGALVLTVGLGNTSFVGLPLLRAVLGSESLGTGVLLDQLGSFLILSTIGAPFAQMISGASRGSRSFWSVIQRPLRFPPFIALLLAIALKGVVFPEWSSALLGGLALTLGPVALVSVGLSLSWRALGRPEIRQPLVTGLILKLGFFPLVYWAIYTPWSAGFPGFPPLILKTILLEASMASMITAGIVAAENRLDPELAQLMVGLSIPISFITVPLWSLVF